MDIKLYDDHFRNKGNFFSDIFPVNLNSELFGIGLE